MTRRTFAMRTLISFLLTSALFVSPSFGQTTYPAPNGSTVAQPTFLIDPSTGRSVPAGSISMTWAATMTIAAATNTTMTDANVVKDPNSGATPTSFSTFSVRNMGSNQANVCEFGGTCSATTGDPLSAGACNTYPISPAAVPSVFSASGTTLRVWNGTGC